MPLATRPSFASSRVALASLLAIAAVASGAACSTASSGDDTSSGSGGAGGSASICSTDPRAMSFSAGMTVKSMDGSTVASLASASPAPPDRGENNWSLKLTSSDGTPMNGAKVTALPWMPDHGHGASVTPTITPMGSDGTYQIENLDLFMPGIWQVTVTATMPSGTASTVVFSFCING